MLGQVNGYKKEENNYKQVDNNLLFSILDTRKSDKMSCKFTNFIVLYSQSRKKEIKKEGVIMKMNKEVVMVRISDIIPNRFQPRLTFDEEALNELANSIKEHGIIQPLILRDLGSKYEIM